MQCPMSVRLVNLSRRHEGDTRDTEAVKSNTNPRHWSDLRLLIVSGKAVIRGSGRCRGEVAVVSLPDQGAW